MQTSDPTERPRSTTPAEASYPLYDLAQTIAHHQSFDPYELAREILAYDNPGHVTVVGLSNSLKLV